MYVNEPTREQEKAAKDRVDAASQEAYELALDCLHDQALQHAIFQRMMREMENAR